MTFSVNYHQIPILSVSLVTKVSRWSLYLYISASFGLFFGTSMTRGFFFGVFGTFSGDDLFFPNVSFFGVATTFSWLPCGDVTSKSDTISEPSPELFRGPQRISAAWIDRTRSWFLAPSNLSQYTLCSHRCLIKQTLLLYSLPERIKALIINQYKALMINQYLPCPWTFPSLSIGQVHFQI